MANSALNNISLNNIGVNDLDKIADEIIRQAGNIKIWLLNGEMGAGKTTLVKSICNKFNVIEHVTSPTFSLVNEYHNDEGDLFYHFDFYRIKNIQEAMDIGCQEYFDSGSYCFLEWSEKISPLLPSKNMSIDIIYQETNKRNIALTKNDW